MFLRSTGAFIFLAAGLVCGCSEPPRGGPRLQTSPVTGVIQVDGQAAELVEITCQAEGENAALKYPLSTMTDKDGKFALTTYQSGDGLPEGVYLLSFKWQEPGIVPKDKFNGAYADPKKSGHKLTVVKGQKNELGVLDLSSKGPSQ